MPHKPLLNHGRSRSRAGFTLVELMIVVAIIGILAVLAVVGYRKLILAAHTSEATHMVQSIRLAEEAYHAEAQTYVSTSADAVSGWYPAAAPGAFKMPWVVPAPPTTSCIGTAGTSACFAFLPVHADGPVAYGYATLANVAGSVPPSIALPNGVTLTGPATSATDWYWVTAKGDVAGTGNPATDSYVVGNSFTNDLYVQDQ